MLISYTPSLLIAERITTFLSRNSRIKSIKMYFLWFLNQYTVSFNFRFYCFLSSSSSFAVIIQPTTYISVQGKWFCLYFLCAFFHLLFCLCSFYLFFFYNLIISLILAFFLFLKSVSCLFYCVVGSLFIICVFAVSRLLVAEGHLSSFALRFYISILPCSNLYKFTNQIPISLRHFPHREPEESIA